jgi:hypothetical protein
MPIGAKTKTAASRRVVSAARSPAGDQSEVNSTQITNKIKHNHVAPCLFKAATKALSSDWPGALKL